MTHAVGWTLLSCEPLLPQSCAPRHCCLRLLLGTLARHPSRSLPYTLAGHSRGGNCRTIFCAFCGPHLCLWALPKKEKHCRVSMSLMIGRQSISGGFGQYRFWAANIITRVIPPHAPLQFYSAHHGITDAAPLPRSACAPHLLRG